MLFRSLTYDRSEEQIVRESYRMKTLQLKGANTIIDGLLTRTLKLKISQLFIVKILAIGLSLTQLSMDIM